VIKLIVVLESRIILKSLKESIIVTLYKLGKKDYSLPSVYRLIALENTIVKVIEKVIGNRLTGAAKEQGLLPWN
jgi:hypothetical protein